MSGSTPNALPVKFVVENVCRLKLKREPTMDNRFGFKDLVLTVLLLAILASIWLGMKQAGRQHSTLVAVTQEVGQQSASQARLERDAR